MLDKTEHAGPRVFDRARAILVNIAAHSDRVRHIAPASCAGLFEFAEQKSFLGSVGKKHVDRFQMRAGHGENVRRLFYQIRGERLAALIADIDAVGFANLDGVKTGGLPANGVHPGRSHFDIAIADQPPEKSFRDRAAADIAGANKEDAFHGKATALAAAERT